MRTTVLRRVLSCILIVFVPVALLATDANVAAMVYSNGPARLNGVSFPKSSAIFSGDLVQTTTDSVAKINALGTSLMVLSDSLVQFEGNAVELEHGRVAVSTSKGMATRAGDVIVMPAGSVWTQFDVTNMDGQVRIEAQKGDLTVSDGTGTTTLAQGQQMTRDESSTQSQPGETKKKKKRKAGGAAPAAGGGALDSPLAIGIGIGAVAGLTTWVLLQGGEPVSPVR
jgi:hypothetical protein